MDAQMAMSTLRGKITSAKALAKATEAELAAVGLDETWAAEELVELLVAALGEVSECFDRVETTARVRAA